jgi:FkbM family methyltransferase
MPPANEPIVTATSDPCRGTTFLERIGSSLKDRLGGMPLRNWQKRVFYWLLQLPTAGGGLVCRLPDGEKVRISPAYRYLTWNLQEYRAFKQALRPGAVALDIGANVGCYSLLFGQWVGPAGKVFAFEPSPDSFAGLCRHITLNCLAEVVIPMPAAVSDASTAVQLLHDSSHGSNRVIFPGEAAGARPTLSVPAVTVDEFCEREKILPDLIKIDVEGSELAVLRGARRTIRACGDRLNLFMEMHPTTWAAVGMTKEDLLTELEVQGLAAAPLKEGGPLWSIEGMCLRLNRVGK